MISWPKVAARSSLAKLPLGSAHQEPERILNASRGPGPDGGRLRVPALPGPAGAHVVRCSGRALRKHGACNCAVSRALRVAHFWSPEWSIMAHLRCPWGRLCPPPPPRRRPRSHSQSCNYAAVIRTRDSCPQLPLWGSWRVVFVCEEPSGGGGARPRLSQCPRVCTAGLRPPFVPPGASPASFSDRSFELYTAEAPIPLSANSLPTLKPTLTSFE